MINFPHQYNPRQATKNDLLNLCWALGVKAPKLEHQEYAVDFDTETPVQTLRETLEKTTGAVMPHAVRMPCKGDLLAVAAALGADLSEEETAKNIRTAIHHKIAQRPSTKLAAIVYGR